MKTKTTRIIPLLFLLTLALLSSSCAKPDRDVPPNADTNTNTPGAFVNDTFYW